MELLDAGKIENQLNELVGNWLAMPVGTAEEQRRAEEYYFEEVFPLSLKLFQLKERRKLTSQEIYGLILTVGTSPEPLILSISACCPQKVLFLYTSQTERYLDVIVDKTGLKVSQVDKRKVDEVNPLDIYRVVLEIWEGWGRRKEVAVDITGGTKSMTGGLAMVGALMGFQLLYVAPGDFITGRRRPRPGSEYLVTLPNPYTVFGTIQEKEVEELLKRCDFHGASKLLEELYRKVPDPRKLEITLSLTRAYEEWDSLNLKAAVQHFDEALRIIDRMAPTAPLGDMQSLFELQREKLKWLSELMPAKPKDPIIKLLQNRDAVEILVCTIYHNANRMAHRGKFDAASLYMYRLLELFEQRRLATYGLDTSAPDYNFLLKEAKLKETELIEKINRVRKTVNHAPLERLLAVVSLLDGYMILEAIGDPFQLSRTFPKAIHWAKFINEIQKRNYSILAHGFIFVSEEQYSNFKALVDSLFDLFCSVEGIQKEDALERYSFIDPLPEKLLSY